MEPVVNASNDLHEFLEFLYGGLEGYIYVSTKNPADDLDWNQHYFRYPEEASRVEVVIQEAREREVYIAPAVYSTPDYRRENVKVSNVVWTEFDGNAPLESAYHTAPSLRIQSSQTGHEHVYWRLSNPITDVEQLEQINRDLTYALSADSSAWDATQILRPPGTYNHKRGLTVGVLSKTDVSYDVSIFDQLPQSPPPLNVEGWEPSVLPDVTQVILKYAFPEDIARLFGSPKLEKGARSTGLMNLAYACCEMGMKDPEIFAVLLNADNRWEKFSKRKDQHKRLAHIITIARHKHPEVSDDGGPLDDPVFVFDFVQFLKTDIEIDWVIDGMLMEQGSMLLVGPSGIGKTQLSLQFAYHLAMGKDFLGYKIPEPQKIIALSLEMGHGELKKIAMTQAKNFGLTDFDRLQENLLIVPHGEKWALNTPVGQQKLINLIEEFRPNGIMIDSVGAAITGNISSDEDVFPLVDFNYRIRKKYNLFLWYIHHMRKASNGGHAPQSQDDVYGNQYLINSSTSSYGVLRDRNGLIKIRNFKNRMAEQQEDFLIKRTETLGFDKVTAAVDDKLDAMQHMVYKKPEHEKGPVEQTKFDL